MIFTYKVRDQYILENINIPLARGKIILLTGIENISFSILGGIISGLFPVEEKEALPQIEELIKYFTGELIISDGKVPSKAFYLGPDPEKHLLFSRVGEEIYAQTHIGNKENQFEILSRFGLGQQFIDRKISRT